MQSPPLTVAECLEKNRRLRDAHAKEVERLTVTLRDQFAMAALTGAMASETEEWHSETCDATAGGAYRIADAMLAARAKKA